MELNARVINKNDWDMLLSWWTGHGWPTPKKDGKPVIAGFIYQTNSKGCWLEYIISKPDYENDRSHLIDMLIVSAEKTALSMGFKYMLFVGKSKGIIKSMEKNGWIKDPKPSYEVMKKLN
jgi:hypothetical protein